MSERIAQVLSLHRITPRCYDLTSVRTGSVRDQLIRAALLADALLQSRLVSVQPDPGDTPQKSAEKKRLLVLGAGVAGVALALGAAEQGADVTVVEKESVPFGTVGSCNWRIVDPTEYDWPHPHWKYAVLPFPLGGGQLPQNGQLPLPPSRLEAARLAAVWSIQHQSILFAAAGTSVPVGAGSVTILYKLDADDLTIDDRDAACALAKRVPGQSMQSVSAAAATDLVRVTSRWHAPRWVDMCFAVVVSCIGFGDEITSERPAPAPGQNAWNGFRGPRFWREYDGMKRSGFVVGPGGARPTAVLISGSGDGAMQDFQRAATGRFGRDLYDLIEMTVGAKRFRPDAIVKDAVLAEDHARRAHGWRPAGSSVSEAFQYWDDQYKLVASEVWALWSVQERAALETAVLRPEVINELMGHSGPRVRILWVIRESTPAFAYGLNRFLSMLVLEILAHLQGKAIAAVSPILRRRNEVTGIIGKLPHVCAGFPTLCYTQQHEVQLTDLATNAVRRDVFDLILIRHGQDPSPLLGGASVPEQQVPFDFPR